MYRLGYLMVQQLINSNVSNEVSLFEILRKERKILFNVGCFRNDSDQMSKY